MGPHQHASLVVFLIVLTFSFSTEAKTDHHSDRPVDVAVIGLTHDHVHWIFGRENRGDIRIVAIHEPNPELQDRYREMYDLDRDLFFSDLEPMLDQVQPEAVTAFNSTYEHLELVRAAAPRGIHVMVEKPLAVNMDHAREMADLARANDIHLLTNYETTWYATKEAAWEKVHRQPVTGELRKMVFRHGHQGPKEIGVSDEFLEWLTDPVLNGGGALMDFGCYGANLALWYMKGKEPVNVTAVTRQVKPEIYSDVDDMATIILEWEKTQAVIQASWNWPYNRKDMHLYGRHGYVFTENDRDMEWMRREGEPVETARLEPPDPPLDDPFSYFAAVVRGDIEVRDSDLSSLANNLAVTRILDAARESAETGSTVFLEND